MGFQLLENAIVVRVLVDVETDRDGAAIEGDWVSLRDYNECTILIQAGALGADIVWQIEQATTNTGTSKKDVVGKTVSHINGTDEGVLKTLQVRGEELDVDGGFDFIRLQAPDPGTAATFAAATYILTNARFAQATMPDPTS